MQILYVRSSGIKRRIFNKLPFQKKFSRFPRKLRKKWNWMFWVWPIAFGRQASWKGTLLSNFESHPTQHLPRILWAFRLQNIEILTTALTAYPCHSTIKFFLVAQSKHDSREYLFTICVSSFRTRDEGNFPNVLAFIWRLNMARGKPTFVTMFLGFPLIIASNCLKSSAYSITPARNLFA